MSSLFEYLLCVQVTSTFVHQIAAKIGECAVVAPMNNINAPDVFPFTAQKRQLEDPGTHTLLGSVKGPLPM
jgi:hypothetical protein